MTAEVVQLPVAADAARAEAMTTFCEALDEALSDSFDSNSDYNTDGESCIVSRSKTIALYVMLLDKVSQLERDRGILVQEYANLKASNDMTMRALVYQAGGYVAIRRETLEEVPNIILYAVQTNEGQLVMRTARNHETQQ